MLDLNLTLDKREVAEIRRALGGAKAKMPKIFADAANETVKTLNSQISKKTDLALPERDIRPPRAGGISPLSKWRFTKATPANPSARITLPYKPISLIHFANRIAWNTKGKGKRKTKPPGVRVKIFKSRGIEVYRHAFAARANGAVQIFDRNIKGRISKRLPINKLVGPSMKGIVEKKPGVYAAIFDGAPMLFKTRIRQQLQRHFDRK